MENSLLDRLVSSRAQISLYAAIRRDLENLLNTRRMNLFWPKEWQELSSSLLAYGMPDFMGQALETAETQKQFCKKMRQIIQNFETRFQVVEVSLLQDSVSHDRVLRMRIEGLLCVKSVLETILLDSELEPETRNFRFL